MKLKLVKLSKKFTSLRGVVSAVEGIDLEINEGEFFVLLGPSGCGKSTILNLIAGLEKPSGGEIFFGERAVSSPLKKIFLGPGERNVAFVFQSYALYPHLNVFENIAFPLRARRESPRRIKEAAERVGSMLKIRDLFSVKPNELSGGQRQRVAIARAIVRRPNVFLLDEPLSNLDAQLRVSTRDELKRLQRRLGVTTVYVTHDQTEALTLGDRIALLREGRIEQVGTPDELYAKPKSVFAAEFIGLPPMNIFRARVFRKGSGFSLRIAGGDIDISSSKISSEGDFIFGIRPEDIEIDSEGGGMHFKANVELIEPMGRERLIRITAEGNNSFSALSGSAKFREGDMVGVKFDLNKLHIFER